MVTTTNEILLESLTNEELMYEFQNGQERALVLLIDRFSIPLLNHINRYVHNIERSEDILQETFIRVYKYHKYYENSHKLSTWIYTIASNLAKDDIRQNKRRAYGVTNKIDYEYDIQDASGSIEEEYIHKELYNIIQMSIHRLNNKHREVIILSDIKGLSYKEISEKLQLSLGTVKSRINRGRKKLQNELNIIVGS